MFFIKTGVGFMLILDRSIKVDEFIG